MKLTDDQVGDCVLRAITRTDVEQFLLLGADDDWNYVGAVVVKSGDAISCSVDLDDLVEAASKLGAARILTAHSHVTPGAPSVADLVAVEFFNTQPLRDKGILIDKRHAIVYPNHS